MSRQCSVELEICQAEIAGQKELLEIEQHLKANYLEQQLLPLDEVHLFKVLEFSKLSIIGINDTITFLLKIPILDSSTATYSGIYLLPNSKDTIIIPPNKFLIEIDQKSYWTSEDCKRIEDTSLCGRNNLSINNCTLKQINTCPTAQVNNNYEIVKQLNNHQILYSSKEGREVLEDCNGQMYKKIIKRNHLIYSKCRIIIGTIVYDNSIPVFEIMIKGIIEKTFFPLHTTVLHSSNFKNPEELKQELLKIETTPIHLKPLVHITHYFVSVIISLVIIIFIIVIIKFKIPIYELLCKSRQIIKFTHRQKEPKDQEMAFLSNNTLYPNLTEDLQT
ncbi:hypothetical protein FQA39_LY14218 [Lamprigera yunnana]|nr:hypothetical protein FQA39_LY14218 [Lamprigera yunnana]